MLERAVLEAMLLRRGRQWSNCLGYAPTSLSSFVHGLVALECTVDRALATWSVLALDQSLPSTFVFHSTVDSTIMLSSSQSTHRMTCSRSMRWVE